MDKTLRILKETQDALEAGSATMKAAVKELDARNEAIAELVEALRPLAAIPYQDFEWSRHPDHYQAMTWNGVALTLGDMKRARAVLAKHTPEAKWQR